MNQGRITEKEELSNLIKYFFESVADTKKSNENCNDVVYDEVKLAILSSLENFLRSSDMTELSFPNTFSVSDQRLVQTAAENMGLRSNIIRKCKNQSTVVVYKNEIRNYFLEPFYLNVTWNTRRSILQLLASNPFTVKEKQEMNQKSVKNVREDRHRGTTGKLMDAVPQVPLMKLNECDQNSISDPIFIPIWTLKNEIIESIKHNPIVIIYGASGCGKTTQIGQIIMQDCVKSGEPCRMICTQPYRLTAHANAQFVTQQRKENIGQTVGYQIRLESKVSPRTLLTFCTNEVLLRTLYGDRGFLNGTTHIIVDEVQERCKNSDLLLCVLNKMQKIYRHVKIIILISIPVSPYDIIPSSSPWSKNSYYIRHIAGSENVSQEKQSNYLVNSLRQYFDYCPGIYVRKLVHDIEELFLEDILNMVDCKFENIDKYKTLYKVDLFKLTFEKWFSYWTCRQTCCGNLDLTVFEIFYKNVNPNLYSGNISSYELSGLPNIGLINSNYSSQSHNPNYQVDYVSIYDDILWLIWSRADIEDISLDFNFDSDNFDVSKVTNLHNFIMTNDGGCIGNNYFKFIFSIILNGFVSVNHQHRMSGLSILMICSFRGFKNVVTRLLSFGADVTTPLIVMENIYQSFTAYLNHIQNTSQINKNVEFYYYFLTAFNKSFSVSNMIYASDLALMTRNFEISDLLLNRVACLSENISLNEVPSNTNAGSNSNQTPFVEDFEFIYTLIKGLLKTIDRSTDSGTTLIFLPDYNHLVQLKTFLLGNCDEIFDKTNRYQIYLLHPCMMIQDLNSLSLNYSNTCRKIILSTSIGESSMNISNVSFVIDTGIETKKVFDDALGVITLKTMFISKVQAAHRASRANNPLNRYCFHLYSLAQYQALPSQRVPDILTQPLNEYILQIKLLAPAGVSINQYLSSLLDFPPSASSRSSIELLQTIGALDHSDELTELGYHLYDLPLDPKYGKMVLSSVLLKCLDPILTIACILNLQDPFVAVSNGAKYRELMDIKKKFASNTYSDHMVLLRAFQFWQKSRVEGWENTFCQKNYLSAPVFEIITGIRTQLLGQLRASGFVKARGNGDIRDLNYNSENWAIVKAAIVSGLPNQFLLYNESQSMLVGNINAKIIPHPASTLYNSENPGFLSPCNYSTNIFIYDKSITSSNISNYKWNEYDCLITNNRVVQIQYMTMVTPTSLALLGQHVHITSSDSEGLDSSKVVGEDILASDLTNTYDPTKDNGIEFRVDEELCQFLLKLRHKWQFLVMRKLKNPAKQTASQDEATLRTIVNVLTLEEQSYGLKQPYGVGTRPRPMAPEFCNLNDTCIEYCKFNANKETTETDISRVCLIKDKSVPITQCDGSLLQENELNNSPVEDQNDHWNAVIPMDRSKLLNNATNHFFVIKLLHESEMCGILHSQVYNVNPSLKFQIEHLLVKGFTIYFIFINGSNNILLGYARILQVIYPDLWNSNTAPDSLAMSDPSTSNNQTFSLSLEVYPGKIENQLILDKILDQRLLIKK